MGWLYLLWLWQPCPFLRLTQKPYIIIYYYLYIKLGFFSLIPLWWWWWWRRWWCNSKTKEKSPQNESPAGPHGLSSSATHASNYESNIKQHLNYPLQTFNYLCFYFYYFNYIIPLITIKINSIINFMSLPSPMSLLN